MPRQYVVGILAYRALVIVEGPLFGVGFVQGECPQFLHEAGNSQDVSAGFSEIEGNIDRAAGFRYRFVCRDIPVIPVLDRHGVRIAGEIRRIAGVQFGSLGIQVARPADICERTPCHRRLRDQVDVLRLYAGFVPVCRLNLTTENFSLQCASHTIGNFVLDCERITVGTLVGFRPEMETVVSLYELCSDANLVACAAYTAFQDVRNP